VTDDSPPPGPSRRRFLKIATCALGGGIGATVVVPAAQYLLYPVGKRTVTTGGEPIDALPVDRLRPGAPPTRVALVAPAQRDAWGTVRDVPLGAAWVRRDDGGKVEALSAVCPHLGCAVGFDAGRNLFRCPCHESTFALDGKRLAGPTERGLDPLPVKIERGRVEITWVRYRVGGSGREKL